MALQTIERCARPFEAVKLDPALERPVGQYSQGMRQRMSLARALLNDPKILLLDEPFSNVDIRSAREMVSLLVEMRNAGKTLFVVTHQAALLEGAADEFGLDGSGTRSCESSTKTSCRSAKPQ